MTHEHDFTKDLDGQITCSICGAMDDDKEPTNATPFSWGDTPVSFEE